MLRHLAIAYGSAVETGELLQLAVDAQIVNPDVGKQLLIRAQRSERLLPGLLRSRRNN
jgi:hypothetical protein